MILYKKRRIVAITVLVPVMLVLLLALNFRIWGGSYTEGDLESIVIQQMDSLEKGNGGGSINERTCLRFCECVCLSGIGTMVVLLCVMFLDARLGDFSLRPGVTLQSLSVRMDD